MFIALIFVEEEELEVTWRKTDKMWAHIQKNTFKQQQQKIHIK